jgi:hypothetical protein
VRLGVWGSEELRLPGPRRSDVPCPGVETSCRSSEEGRLRSRVRLCSRPSEECRLRGPGEARRAVIRGTPVAWLRVGWVACGSEELLAPGPSEPAGQHSGELWLPCSIEARWTRLRRAPLGGPGVPGGPASGLGTLAGVETGVPGLRRALGSLSRWSATAGAPRGAIGRAPARRGARCSGERRLPCPDGTPPGPPRRSGDVPGGTGCGAPRSAADPMPGTERAMPVNKRRLPCPGGGRESLPFRAG